MTASASASRSPNARNAVSSVASSADLACPTSWAADAASTSAASSSAPDSAERAALRGFAQRVELGQPPDVVDECVVLARLRIDRVDLAEAELQPVGLLRQFPCPLGPVGQVAAGGLP